MIEITLPWPPSVNHYYGSRGSRRFIKKAGVKFRKEVAELVAQQQCAKQEGRLAIFITVYPPDNRRRDVDNVCKAMLDGLQHAGCYDDDCQIDGLHVEREHVTKGGKVRVIICQHRTPDRTKAVWGNTLVDYPNNERDFG